MLLGGSYALIISLFALHTQYEVLPLAIRFKRWKVSSYSEEAGVFIPVIFLDCIGERDIFTRGHSRVQGDKNP